MLQYCWNRQCCFSNSKCHVFLVKIGQNMAPKRPIFGFRAFRALDGPFGVLDPFRSRWRAPKIMADSEPYFDLPWPPCKPSQMFRVQNGLYRYPTFSATCVMLNSHLRGYFRPSKVSFSTIFAYQIIVADAADAVSVNFSGRCKFLQI